MIIKQDLIVALSGGMYCVYKEGVSFPYMLVYHDLDTGKYKVEQVMEGGLERLLMGVCFGLENSLNAAKNYLVYELNK